jgi:hypothetical protein
MSDETRANLDAAISAHIADAFPGHYTSGWIVVTSSAAIDRPNTTNYRMVSPDSQPFHIDDGLIKVGARILQDSWDEDASEEDDDD